LQRSEGLLLWSNSIFIHPDNLSLIEAEFAVPFFYKLLPLFSCLLGAGIVFVVYHFFYASLVLFFTNFKHIYRFFFSKWYFDLIYNSFIVYPLLSLGYLLLKFLIVAVLNS
jgi:NADH-ubiquinone oxidoreductase chain 5